MKRFWSKVRKTGHCWNWIASSRGNGYGSFRLQGKIHDAHRVSWYLAHGRWPEQWILHTCDNRRCVRPAHLYEGTPRDNVLDMYERGRARPVRGERVIGHKLTWEQVRSLRAEYVPFKNGARRLAKKYGVCHTTVQDILKGVWWKE